MVVMIAREIVRDHGAVGSVDGVQVAGTTVMLGSARLEHHAVVVNEDRRPVLHQLDRSRSNVAEDKTGERDLRAPRRRRLPHLRLIHLHAETRAAGHSHRPVLHRERPPQESALKELRAVERGGVLEPVGGVELHGGGERHVRDR